MQSTNNKKTGFKVPQLHSLGWDKSKTHNLITMSQSYVYVAEHIQRKQAYEILLTAPDNEQVAAG